MRDGLPAGPKQPRPLARPHFGDRIDLLLATVRSQTRIIDIALRRPDVRKPDHRFLLALLMNVPNRQQILALVGARHDGDPLETVQRWLRELIRREQNSYVSLLDVELACDDTATGPGEGGELLLQAMTEQMLGGVRGPALLDALATRLSPGFFASVRDGVPELEALLRNGALHALFVD